MVAAGLAFTVSRGARKPSLRLGFLIGDRGAGLGALRGTGLSVADTWVSALRHLLASARGALERGRERKLTHVGRDRAGPHAGPKAVLGHHITSGTEGRRGQGAEGWLPERHTHDLTPGAWACDHIWEKDLCRYDQSRILSLDRHQFRTGPKSNAKGPYEREGDWKPGTPGAPGGGPGRRAIPQVLWRAHTSHAHTSGTGRGF